MFDEKKKINVEEIFKIGLRNKESYPQAIKLCKALSHQTRLDILNQLLEKPSTVTRLAKLNQLDNSTTLFHLKILEDADLIFCRSKPNSKGKALVFYINFESLEISMNVSNEKNITSETQSIGVGDYTTGYFSKYMRLLTDNGHVVLSDNDIYNPIRFNSKLLCVDSGYFIYDFSNKGVKERKIESIEISLEICSESPYYSNDWKSEISFYLNNHFLLKYISPGDFGDKRGKLNPDWWNDKYTQYGRLLEIRITNEDIKLNGEIVKEGRILDSLKLKEGNSISLKISSCEAERYDGGFNIFGKTFGNHPQDIELTINYLEK